MARRVDQLTFQVEELQAADVQPGEEQTLTIERNRLANAEQLSQLAGETQRLLIEGSDEQPAASDLLGEAARLISNLAKLDESLEEQHQLANTLSYQLEDLAATMRDYSENIDFDPGRLQEIEERLSLIFSLKRKYGDTLEEVIAFGEKAQAELDTISHSEERIETLQVTTEQLRQSIGQAAMALSHARRQAGRQLADAVLAHLADLGMEQADFMVAINWEEAPDGVYVEDEDGRPITVACNEQGIDQIEFLITANPGEPLKPLAKVASGGETSRIMLALKTVLALVDDTPTLIFDEIDQGIGGRIGSIVGRKLWGLGHQGNHQVLCITHLPQIAGYGDTHYQVAKHIEGSRTHTEVHQVTDEARIDELAQMLGALSDSTRQSARDILSEAAATRQNSQTNKPSKQGVLL